MQNPVIYGYGNTKLSAQQIISISPVIKLVGTSCNLRCPYCFYEGKQDTKLHVMNENILITILGRLFSASPMNIQFIWHGGEPLLAGLEYFKRIVDLQDQLAPPNIKIRNSVQTNATLINEEWANFFAKNDFGVGVSLDGPQDIHNRTRFNTAGKGSFGNVMRGINHLRNAGINVGAIAVVNSYSVKFPDEIFAFFYQNGLSFSANECLALPDDPPNVKNLAVDPIEYVHFLLRIFDLWLETEDINFEITPLTDLVRAVMGHKPKLCKFLGSCHQHITIDSNGDVYSCDRYLSQQGHFGSLISSSLEDIFATDKFQNYFYVSRQKIKSLCATCKWFNICQGWCIRTWNDGKALTDLKYHGYCKALKLLFSEISKKVESLGYSTSQIFIQNQQPNN